MKSFGDILKSGSLSSPLMRGLQATMVIENAQKTLIEEFGDEITKFASPAFFKNGTLTIAFLSSAASQELKLREKQFIDKLNTYLKGTKVTHIRYMT